MAARDRSRSELNSTKYWRRRAKEARADADQTTDRKLKHMMLGFAEGYERVAKRIDKLAEKSPPQDSKV
jgi:hypothetical protein